MDRYWNRCTDGGAVHVMGSGRMIVYGSGPEIIQCLARPLSADSFCEIRMPGVDACRSRRVEGTAVWRHTLEDGTVITDLTDVAHVCFVRRVEAAAACEMRLRVERVFCPAAAAEGETLAFEAKNGVGFYTYDVDLHPRRFVAVGGSARISRVDEETWAVTFPGGEGFLYISDSEEELQAERKEGFDRSAESVTAYWQGFLSRMKAFPSWLSEICEDVAVMIKSQQAEDGGILAGYPFHLAYVRDQFGTARGLLAMGFCREAERLMYFYKSYFDEYGVIHNAQSVGRHGVFHVHENDNVEITGYLALLPFMIYKENRSEAFLQDMMPLIRWSIRRQVGEMRDGMLPFNGDETYIAGGFLPRSAIYDASAEATMLLAESIRRYQDYTGDDSFRQVWESIRGSYLSHFERDGRLMANNPDFTPLSAYPAERRGACENCKAVTRLYRTDRYRYLCAQCRDKGVSLPLRDFEGIELASSKLALAYADSDLVPREIMAGYLQEMAEAYRADGRLPSGCPEGNAVGYDYGMFLYALTAFDHPLAREIRDLTLSVRDETGVWCEYYKNGRPWNTRCRPWESGVNIEAIIRHCEKYGG